MLYLDAPIGPIRGMMIYRDHQDEGLFHYVPERPRLALNDGVPEFVFLKYRRDITDNPAFDPETKQELGGGFLAFTVDLGVSDEELDEIKGELAQFASGEVRLAPIQFRKGSVRLSISKDTAEAPDAPPDAPRGLTFFEETYGATEPSLFGFNRATFAIILSQEGATLLEAGMRSGISPIGVIYDLEFLGLRPAFNVKITAEYHRIYEHLEVQFGARGQIYAVALAVDIAAAFQKLRDEGAIKVEVLNFTDDEDLTKKADEAFNWFKTELLKDFFKSSLEPPSFMRQGGPGGLAGQLQQLLGALGGSDTTTPSPQRGQPTTTPPTSAPPPENQASGVTSTTETNRAAANTGGGAGGTGGTGASNISPFQVGFSLKFYRQEELKTRTFEYSMQAAVARDAAPQGMFATLVANLDLNRAIREVSLDDDFFDRLVATVSMGADLQAAGISAVAVNLEYPAERKPGQEPEHVDGFLFRPDQLDPRTFTCWLDARKQLGYRYQMDIHFRPDSPWLGPDPHVTSEWAVSKARQLALNPLDELELFDLEVALGAIAGGTVAEVHVDLRYADSGSGFRAERTLVVRPGAPAEHWRLRLTRPETRVYEHRATYVLADGARIVTPWATAPLTLERQSLVVPDPFQGKLNIRLVPLLDPANLIEAVLDISYRDPDTGYERRVQEVFSPDDPNSMKRRTLSLPTLAPGQPEYSYALTVVRADGSIYATDPTPTDDSALTITDGPGVPFRVAVQLVGPQLASAGLLALKVDLVGPGDEPDRDTALFTPSQAAPQAVTLVQEPGEGTFTYRYAVTAYDQQGRPRPAGGGQSSDRTLLITVPAA